MHHAPLPSIRISPNRQRRDFDEDRLLELSESIGTTGLLHALVVRSDSDGSVVLVAGERRLRAIEMLNLQGRTFDYGNSPVPLGHVPVVTLGELDEVEAEEAELAENIIRLDLTWQEKTEAIARLAALKERQDPTATRQEIGEAIFPDLVAGAASFAVRQATILQRHMATDPDVAKAKNVSEALKIVKRKEDARVNIALARDMGGKSATDLYSAELADCRDWLRNAPDAQFDVILIDPPYGMGADSFGDAAGKMVGIEHKYDDSPDYVWPLMKEIFPHFMRITKPEAHLYVWCDIDFFPDLRAMAAACGWWVHRTPLINIKRDGGRVPWPEHGPRRSYELVLYAVKGRKPVTAIYSDVFTSAFASDEDTAGHGAAKPIESYTELLKRSCRPGDSVVDFFAGTGTILDAAKRLSLRATAVERDEANYGLILKRLERLK
jgi:adenine-specific DNA-methyltransferase